MSETLLGDRYILGPLLGRGGMAEVRRGRDIRLERDVAIKRLRPDLAGDAVFQARFRREAQAAAGLNHPNIVSVYDTGEQFDPSANLDIPYIVMELVVGHTLRDLLQDSRKIQPERALALVQAVLAALEYSHRHGIIHRDIKPANVMVTTSGEVKVMDFGIARAVSDTAASMTQTAAVIGTPQYISPEQIRGETVDRRSDVYATGCLLYELLAGQPPFRGDSPVSLAYQHVREAPVPPSQIDPVVSAGMDAICLKALAKDPAERYQTAKDMSDDIGRLLGGQQVTAVIPPPPGDPASAPTQLLTAPVPTHALSTTTTGTRALPLDDELLDEDEPPRRNKVLIIVIVALAVVLIGVGVFIFWYLGHSKPPVTETATVPWLYGMTEQAAIDELDRVGLDHEVKKENGAADTTVNQVIKQDPARGEVVDKGTKVTITINIGPKKGKIPDDLLGKDRDEVVQLLKDAGFENILPPLPAPTEKAEDKPNTVTRMDPAPGTEVALNASIQIYYATGQTTVPPLIGLTEAEAIQELVRLGFVKLPDPLTRETTEVAEGLVVDQDPVAHSVVNRTEVTIKIWIAKTPAPPPPPTTQPPDPPPPSQPASTDSPTATATP
jgi:serine/threonine-protein kinase